MQKQCKSNEAEQATEYSDKERMAIVEALSVFLLLTDCMKSDETLVADGNALKTAGVATIALRPIHMLGQHATVSIRWNHL